MFNRVAIAIIGSPLHWLMGKSLLVIGYEGRRTGRRYSVPVQAAPGPNGSLLVLAGRPDTKTWWRNFDEPRAVTVTRHGRRFGATARVVDRDPEAQFQLLRRYRAAFPRTLRDGRPAFFKKPWRPTEPELREAAAGELFVVLEPDAAD